MTLDGDHISLAPAPRQVQLKSRPDGLLTSDLDIPTHGPERGQGRPRACPPVISAGLYELRGVEARLLT